MRSSDLVRLVAIISTTFQALSYPFDILQDDLIQAAISVHGAEGQGAVEEQGIRPVGEERGWLGRWLALGGEGEVNVPLSGYNLTFPHRPAAFPTNLPRGNHLPLSGYLIPFTSLLHDDSDGHAPHTIPRSTPIQACLPALNQRPLSRKSPLIRATYETPPIWLGIRDTSHTPILLQDTGVQAREGGKKRIALIERGGCDFAMKVYAAQERGAGAVIVGDMAIQGEGREEGLGRKGGLITMFSPEDTDNIHIPSVFISRSAFVQLMDVFNSSISAQKEGIYIEISDGGDDSATLSSMLSFALLMPSCFLLATIAIHRLRVARQKEADRAPALVVLSLPERVWQPDIVWEKDDTPNMSSPSSRRPSPQRTQSQISLLPPISAKDVVTPPAQDILDPMDTIPGPSTRPGQPRRKSSRATITKKRYFSKDECAICMDEFHAGDIVRILPCGHVFHKEECDEWLLKWRRLCPTCRADVTLPPGSNVQGASVTPVHGVTTEEILPDNNNGIRGTIRDWLTSSRQRLFGRGQDDVTERTPLVGAHGGQTERTA